MGWTWGEKNFRAAIRRVLEDVHYTDGSIGTTAQHKAIRHGDSFNVWAVVERYKDGKFLDKEIVLHLIEKQDGEWGWKSIPETQGPYAMDCPIDYLKIVTDPGTEDSNAFRRRVIAAFTFDMIRPATVNV